METKITTTATTAQNTIGERILAHRPGEMVLNILLLPLCIGAMINVAFIASFLNNFDGVGHIVAVIIFILEAFALYGIYFELFAEDAPTYSFRFFWGILKYIIAVNLSAVCYFLLFGNITSFATKNLMGIELNGVCSHAADNTFAGVLILMAIIALLVYSAFAFKGNKPQAATRAAMLLILAFVINICLVPIVW